MMEIQLINELAPEHERTSCSDGNLNGNQYYNEFGAPRCTRCCLLHRIREGEWPDGTFPVHTQIMLGGDERITESIHWKL